MHYLCSCDIYFSTTYQLSVYYITYETLYHTHPGPVTEAEKEKCSPTKNDMEFERNYLLTLSSNHPENYWRLMKYFILKNIR